MSPDARRRFAAKHPLQGRTLHYPPIAPHERVEATRDELIRFGRRHRCTTRARFAEAVAKDSRWAGKLTIAQVTYLFGGWGKYIAEIGSDPATWGDPAWLDDAALAKFCAEHNLYSRAAYRAARGKPAAKMLPSVREIVARFGSWGLFGLLCRTYNLDGEIDRYFRACKAAGRRLSPAEAAKRGICLQDAIATLGRPLFEELLDLRAAAAREDK